ncbi:MAG: Smr/MutS family protein [Pseudomonadota bacterium]
MSQKTGQDDSDVFRQACGDVTPLKADDRRLPEPPPRRYRNERPAPSSLGDNLSDHGAPDTAPTEYLGNGIGRLTLRDLRRGRWPLEDALDLHGLSSDEARRLLMHFLHEAQARGLRCVNVIHGKGWHSTQGEGLLKRLTRHWLMQHPQVLAFCEAPPQAGGSGAVWVLLKAA